MTNKNLRTWAWDTVVTLSTVTFDMTIDGVLVEFNNESKVYVEVK